MSCARKMGKWTELLHPFHVSYLLENKQLSKPRPTTEIANNTESFISILFSWS